MKGLELRIPPPLVCLLTGAGMWALARLGPIWDMPRGARIALALTLALAGIGFQLAGLLAFRRAKTTINPMKPQATSALVATGVYRLTRNPMYVGFALLLGAWAAWLAAPWALLGPAAFVLYIDRFQIVPEERVLSGMFGEDYRRYTAQVRRWL